MQSDRDSFVFNVVFSIDVAGDCDISLRGSGYLLRQVSQAFPFFGRGGGGWTHPLGNIFFTIFSSADNIAKISILPPPCKICRKSFFFSFLSCARNCFFEFHTNNTYLGLREKMMSELEKTRKMISWKRGENKFVTGLWRSRGWGMVSFISSRPRWSF